jgi:hypothetical protein
MMAMAAIWLAGGCGKSEPPKPVAADPKVAKPTNAPVAPAKTNLLTTNATNVVTDFKSVFDEKMKGGRDPFFPVSTRRGASSTPTNLPPPVIIRATLKLKGIVGNKGHRLALINGTAFAEGEEYNVRVSPTSLARVKCIQIGDTWVKVRVENNPDIQELHLTDK